jgi:hypothetical protein
LSEAIKDIGQVPAEGKDIDVAEGIELGQIFMADAIDYMAVLGIQNPKINSVIKILEFVKGFGGDALEKVVDLLKYLNLIK